ncbi:33kDa oxygen evolving of photosystem II [Chlorella sorokiniana]|uniref:33kDa oxygen evolving of photosystem II n=1 Tax=Chlorella sorokiniana TaxID=3076 RepID=A0A2P6TWR3_CHLSO|nr:33kDa oxygen evolving of photosystem II [Chlorella sorokiniana]|eukprot:PRW58503.1 33kDa oxygen evolving of photosystem II [Chlorella sorokiniana]
MLAATALFKPAAAAAAPSAARPRARCTAAVRCSAVRPEGAQGAWVERCARGAAAFAGSLLMAQAALAGNFTFDELQAKSYLEVKGTTLANQCPILGPDAKQGLGDVKAGSFQLDRFCMEPTSIKVKVPGSSEFEPSTLLTRSTYSLDQMSGSVTVKGDGTVALKETDGIDFSPVTVKIRGGEMVPFMFTVKNLNVEGKADGLSGEFLVPSYRGATFMDPQGRGAASGWEYVKGLAAAGAQEELASENVKSAAASKGEAAFAIASADAATGEIAGVFVTRQLADDDLGAKDPATIEIEGIWYGQIS